MKRAVLYLRQSTYREDSISLELQERACRRHCEARGYHVVAVEADPGISGRTFKRPAVARVMEMIETQQADVIVLWKWSRLSRSRKDWAIAADRVDVAGGSIESATEDIDVTTSHGRLARGMLVEIAAFESERIGDQWRETHARRVSRGLPANGKHRFGYRRAGEGFEPDPETAPILAEAYRRFIAGDSAYTLVAWLHSIGARTAAGYGSSGGEFSRRTVIRMLDSGFGAGLILSHGEHLPGAHDPVISMQEWEAYRARRAAQAQGPQRRKSKYLFSGLVRCGLCGAPMTAGTFGSHIRVPKYRCRGASEKRLHAGGYVQENTLEATFLEWLAEMVDDIEARTAREVKAAEARRVAESAIDRVTREIDGVDTALTRLTVQLAEGTVTELAYKAASKSLEQKRARLAETLGSAMRERQQIPADLSEVGGLLAVWPVMSLERRREAAGKLMKCVRVWPGRPRARVEIVPAWA